MDIQRTELRTERLLLRPWRFSDLDDAFANASDPEWARYLWRVPQPYTRRDAEEFIARAVADGWNGQAHFAIESEEHAIGGVRLGTVDPAGMTGSIGYNVARPHWGRGIATEAVGCGPPLRLRDAQAATSLRDDRRAHSRIDPGHAEAGHGA